MASLFQASNEVNGINNTIGLTTSHVSINIMCAATIFHNNLMSPMNNITGTVNVTSNESSREKKSKLMKVYIDRTTSALDKMA